MIKECKKHGETDHALEKRGYYRCRKCNSAKVSEQRRRNKLKLVQERGGRCQSPTCSTSGGYDRCPGALHFHHIDPENKSFALSKSGSNSLAKQRKEAEKCFLLCSNCHAEVEAGLQEVGWFQLDRTPLDDPRWILK